MQIVSLNISPVREVIRNDRVVRTGIFKQPTSQPVLLGERGFVGDDQADKQHHGAPTQAAYAFSAEEYAHWRTQLARDDLHFGLFGENLTVSGLDDDTVCIGDTYLIGEALAQVTFGREPCSTLAMAVGDVTFPKAFLARRRIGPYFRVLRPGIVRVGDAITLHEAHPAKLSITESIYLAHFAKDEHARWREAAAIEAMDERCRARFAAKTAPRDT